MNIVIASHSFLPSIGGVATNVSILAKGFVDAGHDVTLVTTTPGPNTGYDYKVIRMPKPWTLFRLYLEADILIQSNLALKLIYPLLFIHRKFALRHHSESAFSLSNSMFSLDIIRRYVFKRATHFMTSAYIGRKSGLPHYYVTPPFANPRDITEDVIFPISEKENAIFVGRLEPEKGILYLLDRWKYIREKLGVKTLRIIGAGSLREEVERRIQDGEVENVEFLGYMQRDGAAKEMGAAVYSFIPSLWEEPFGAVALESLAARCIVILTDRGGLPEATGTLGFQYDPENESSFRDALGRATRFYAELCASGDARSLYKSNIEAHCRRFLPSEAVRTIIEAMES